MKSLSEVYRQWLSIRMRVLPIVNLVSFVILIAMNVIASTGVWRYSQGDISNMYSTRFTPDGYAFSIWSLIYSLWGLWILIHLIQGLILGRDNELYNGRVGILFAVNCMCQAIWLVTWQFQQMWLSNAVMNFGILATSIAMYHRLGVNYGRTGQHQKVSEQDSDEEDGRDIKTWEFWIMYGSISLYIGWICVATIANWSCALVSLNKTNTNNVDFSPIGFTPQIWSAVMQTVAAMLTLFGFMLIRRDVIQPLVTMWALVAIYFKQKKYPNSDIVTTTALVNTFIIAVAWMILVLYNLSEYVRGEGYWIRWIKSKSTSRSQEETFFEDESPSSSNTI